MTEGITHLSTPRSGISSRSDFIRACEDFIRTIPQLQYDAHKVEEVDTEGEDHIADEWRYFCMSRPITPMEAKPEPKHMSDPLDMFTRY